MAGRHEATANLKSFEATASGTSQELSFGSSIVKLMATNDSPTTDLSIMISQDWVTLKPKETLTLPVRISSVQVSGNSTPYRIWGFW